MTTIELKSCLMHRIAEINDVSFLKALKTIIDSKINSETIILTPEQREEIAASQKEISEGKFVSHKELEKEFAAWLNVK